MTTTGDPVVLDEQRQLEGDDIVVEPEGPGSQHPRRRARGLIIGGLAATLAIAAVAIVLASRGDSGGNTAVTTAGAPGASSGVTHAQSERNAARARKAADAGRPPASVPPAPKAAHPTPVARPPAAPVTPDTPVSVVVPPPPAPVALPSATPPASPPSVLHWTTAPAALSIKAGAHASLTVTIVNPTAGTVTLGHPLSCPPTLRPVGGAPVGGAVCVEMAQVLAPSSTTTARYVIYATDTGDASGAPLPAGRYVASIEHLHDVKVTVTAS